MKLPSRKRRPNASDRDIIDALAQLKSGQYCVEVERLDDAHGFGIANIKREGSLALRLSNGTRITVW